VLANLFLHYVFDGWLRRKYPTIPFERYADDAICHCQSEAQALELRQALEQMFAECKLQLHPQKTKVVYCKDANRSKEYPERSFDFLGYTFRPREAVNRHGKRFTAFIPAVSKKAAKKMRCRVRRWRLHRRNDLELADIAKQVRPVLTGWVRYYGRFYPSKLQEELRTIDVYLVRWATRNTSGFNATRWRHGTGCGRSNAAIRDCSHIGAWDQRPDDRSRMNREVHVRFWESAGLQCPAPLDYRQEYRDVAEARASIERVIEKVYNQRRLHSALGYLPPAEFEARITQAGLLKGAASRQLSLR
jgi:RNA-directed DNA polymerase